jgi:hypothetical protein
VLDRCHGLLRPGGVLVVNYPDIGSLIARILGRRWPFLTSVHLSYFDRRTIRRMLEKTGYDVDGVTPTRTAFACSPPVRHTKGFLIWHNLAFQANQAGTNHAPRAGISIDSPTRSRARRRTLTGPIAHTR